VSSTPVPSSELLAARCAADGEFRLAARHWTGGLRLEIGERTVALRMEDGVPTATDPGDGPGVVTLAGADDVWDQLLAEVPPPGATDVVAAFGAGLRPSGDGLLLWQYYPAIQRAVELLRPAPAAAPAPTAATGPTRKFDSPVGRYVHLDLDGVDHRIYFEEAGAGIPLLLQHTAGAHGIQWRHLFECAEITDHFRVIAYDLPFHGKSVPPVGVRWWEQRYQLTSERARAVPVTLAAALELDQPVFMGCSVGGLLALDLARHHPDVFRAVVSLEGSLRIDADVQAMAWLWHPQVSNETKARLMEGLMSPTSPIEYRKETAQVYGAGWPPLFAGDLHYYFDDHDLTADAGAIDTALVGVHILSGEYDHSAPPSHGRAAHEAIAGSTFAEMPGMGHFPMSEDPERFLGFVLPVLESIRTRGR